MRKYDLADRDIATKYKSFPAEYYAKSLCAKVKGEDFTLQEPAFDWKEECQKKECTGLESGISG